MARIPMEQALQRHAARTGAPMSTAAFRAGPDSHADPDEITHIDAHNARFAQFWRDAADHFAETEDVA